MKKKNLVKESELPLFEQSSKASSSPPPPVAQAPSASKKIATSSFQTVKGADLLPVAIPDSSTYGLCRCGKSITIPGLDGYLCARCGWIGKILGCSRR